MRSLSRAGIAGLVACIGLVSAACASDTGDGTSDASLAALAAEQSSYDGDTVRTQGIVRTFDAPRHYWIEDAGLNRVELVPATSVETHVGELIEVEGRFTFREHEGRRITVERVVVLDEAPEVEEVATLDGPFTRAAPGGFAPLLEQPDALVINVHVPYEGEIEGTDAHVPFDRIADAAILPEDRGARIALYCRSGSMSTEAAETLVGLGYTDVWELEGGMVAWDRSGRSLVTNTDGAGA